MWTCGWLICGFVIHVFMSRFVTSPWAQLLPSACWSTMPVQLHALLILYLSFTHGWELTWGQKHKRKCLYNIDIYIDWKKNFYGPFPIFHLCPPSLLSAVVCILTTTGENGTTLSFCQQFRSWWKDITATSDLISMVGMHLIINLDQKKLLHCSYLSAYFQILLCLRLW